MEDFLSLVIFLVICFCLSSARKKRGKQAGSASQVRKPAARKERISIHRAEGPSPSRDLPLPEVNPQPEAGHGSLRSSSMEGIDPCHDDPGSQAPCLPAACGSISRRERIPVMTILSPYSPEACRRIPRRGQIPVIPLRQSCRSRKEAPVPRRGRFPHFPGMRLSGDSSGARS